MKKYTKYIVYGIIAIIVIVIIRRLSRPKGNPDLPKIPTGGSGSGFKYNPLSVNRQKVFGFGATNSQETGYLQVWLNTYYSANLKIDGDFGNKTLSALQKAKPGSPPTFSLDSLGI